MRKHHPEMDKVAQGLDPSLEEQLVSRGSVVRRSLRRRWERAVSVFTQKSVLVTAVCMAVRLTKGWKLLDLRGTTAPI